jgi:hypothetical protein
MASLIERLQKLQVQTPEELPDVSQYSLAQMDVMRVEFGTKHVGKTYKEVWSSDQQWITWFLKHYQNSKKGVHRMMLHYIALKIERAEMEGKSIPVVEPQPEPVKNPTKALGKPSVMALTPKAKSRPMVTPEVEDLSVWELGEMEAEETPIEPNMTENLEQRMQNVEGALQSIIMHLEHMATNHPSPLSRAEATEQ